MMLGLLITLYLSPMVQVKANEYAPALASHTTGPWRAYVVGAKGGDWAIVAVPDDLGDLPGHTKLPSINATALTNVLSQGTTKLDVGFTQQTMDTMLAPFP